MRNYKDLPPKDKFIRTCICLPVSIVILIVFYIFCNNHFILGSRFIIKYVVSFIIVVIVGAFQLASTYLAWKRDENDY